MKQDSLNHVNFNPFEVFRHENFGALESRTSFVYVLNSGSEGWDK